MMFNISYLKKNIIANYIGQFYLLIIAILMVPYYLKYMGVEAYGLVGFFALIQSWMMILDMGLSPTMLREVAKVKADGTNQKLHVFKHLFHSVEFIFIIISLFTILSIIGLSSWISVSWLTIESLDINDVSYSISLIGVMVGLRFVTSLYKSGISGAEEQVWLNKMNIVIATFRYVGVLFVLHFISSDFKHFFEYQMIVAIAEVLVFASAFYKFLDIGRFKFYFSLNAIRPIFSFSFSIAYSGVIWIFITQLDKLILSGFLPLKEYGYFALLGMIANAIIQMSAPISKAILPRMTNLLSQNKEKEMLMVYKQATQVFSIILFSVTGIIVCYSHELLYAWTGSIEAANWGENILIYYTVGNALVSFSGFAFYLQYVHGNLKMHLKFYTLVVFVLPPIAIWSIYSYGAIGSAVVWLIFSILFFFIWVPIIQNIFAPKLYKTWILQDIAPIFIMTIAYLILISLTVDIDISFERNTILLTLFLLGTGLLLLNILASSIGRKFLRQLRKS